MTAGVNVPGFIVMAVFRPDPELLRRQIASIRKQTVRDWTCLVGIDGLDSDTRSFVEEIVHGDTRFSVVEFDQNIGHYRHFERLLESVPATAPWFALSDQDDVWHPDKLRVLVGLLRSAPDVTAAMGQAVITDRSGKVLGRTCRRARPIEGLLLKNEVTGSFLVGRRALLVDSLPFPDGTSAARHDHWLGVVATARGRILVGTEPLQEYVQHERNVIGEVDLTRSKHGITGWRRPNAVLVALDEVTLDVWGWRVSMARALLARVPVLGGRERRTIESVARGRLSWQLCWSLATIARHCGVRPRVLAGVVGTALWWPVAGRRASPR